MNLQLIKSIKNEMMENMFELNLDDNGRPCIKIRSYEYGSCLGQSALNIFLDAVKDKGCVLKEKDGRLDEKRKVYRIFEIQIAE